MKMNNFGMGLTQVIVAIGITSVLISAMVALTTNQARENRALTEKLAALDLQRSVISTVSDPAICTHIVVHGATTTFNASLVNTATPPPPIDLGTILYATATPPGPKIAEVGTIASPISSSLKVSSIEIADISCVAPCDPLLTSSFNAVIRVNFDISQSVRSIAPAMASVILQTTGAGATKTITGCGGTASASTSLSGYQMITQWIPVCNAYVPLCCPGTKKLLGGSCYSDWGWCSSSAMSGSCFYGTAWTGYAGGSMCGGGIQITITCAD